MNNANPKQRNPYRARMPDDLSCILTRCKLRDIMQFVS